MSPVTERDVIDALRDIRSDGSDLVTAGMVTTAAVKDGNVQFAIEVDPERAREMEPVRRAAEDRVRELPGVISVTAVLTAHRDASTRPSQGTQQRRQPARESQDQGGGPASLPGIRSIVAVASGKGGVGKSTVAANLAVALADTGLSVGLLDSDVYGPSMPRMMGISGRPQSPDGKRLLPMEGHGVRCMSIGFLVEEETPMIWRGPMVMSALQQMLNDVAWGELDVLVLDLPPGTGDAQLTIAQRVPVTGAVIVSTPQDIALLDARRGMAMFNRVETPVFGIIENMSFFLCPNCGHEAHIFGHGGARDEAERLGVDFLGEVPLELSIREAGDRGVPIVRAQPDGPHARAFREIADRVHHKIEEHVSGAVRQPPRIVFVD